MIEVLSWLLSRKLSCKTYSNCDISSDDSYLGEHRNIGSQLVPSASEDRCGYTPMAIGTGLDQIRVVESVVWPLLVNIS